MMIILYCCICPQPNRVGNKNRRFSTEENTPDFFMYCELKMSAKKKKEIAIIFSLVRLGLAVNLIYYLYASENYIKILFFSSDIKIVLRTVSFGFRRNLK